MPANLEISAPNGTDPNELHTYVACVNFMAHWIDKQTTEEKPATELLTQFNSNVATAMMGSPQGSA